MRRPCGRCGALHLVTDAPSVGRFRTGGPLGYRARYPGAPLRSSRAEALEDVCNARQGRRVTCYDTGERAEPHAWPLTDADSYGRVDFDDDEGRTVATIYLERTADGDYAIHIEGEAPVIRH